MASLKPFDESRNITVFFAKKRVKHYFLFSKFKVKTTGFSRSALALHFY